MTTENKNKVISGIGTALFLLVVMLVCMAFGYDPPDPPIPEEGVEVNVGNSDMGLGDNPMPEASEPSSAPRPASATEQLATQNTESSVPLYSSNKPSTAKHDNETPTTTKPEPPKEPEINKNALFNGNKGNKNNNQNAGSEGNTSGSGNMGKPDGDPNSNRYDGQPGKGGPVFKLDGRSKISLPSPPNNQATTEGTVVVKIWVDRAGNVIKTEVGNIKGSKMETPQLKALAVEAAKKAKFSPNNDPNAADVQVGTITYKFVF